MSDKAKKHDPGAAALLCALEARVIAFCQVFGGGTGPLKRLQNSF